MLNARHIVLWAALLAGCARTPCERVEWTTMGTLAALQSRGADPTVLAQSRARVQACYADIEQRLNAHAATSEIRRLAPLSESAVVSNCSDSVRDCYRAAFRLMRESDGAFNPRWRGTNTLDLGAIAKGFALDGAAAKLGRAGSGDRLLDLGGNLKSVRGTWRIGIAGSDRALTLSDGMACATSATYYRGHHIFDGRTGRAVSNGVASVTVVHPSSAMLADGLSTTLFVLGKAEGERFLQRFYPEAKAYWIPQTDPAVRP